MVAILGPTATGKSGLAMRLADRLDGEIVNADALQAYRGLDVGTAKPSIVDRQRVPHHLIDILDPDEVYSAGEFARRARAAIEEIRGRGRLPLVVGGSGLYLRALLEGISPLPPKDPQTRHHLDERLAEEGLPALARQLAELDPDAAERLSATDSQRVLRALEVALSTGKPLSEWQRERPFGSRRLAAVRIGLTLPRAILYDRIDDRVGSMVRSGWVDEVRGLLHQGWQPSARAFQAIGYRQLVQHVQRQAPLDECVEDIRRATRRYAKRQETWFRKERDIAWFAAEQPDELAAVVVRFLATEI